MKWQRKHKNNNLISYSEGNSIIFYFKDISKYKKDYKKPANVSFLSPTQTKVNEKCHLESIFQIIFFDLIKKIIKSSISNINQTG